MIEANWLERLNKKLPIYKGCTFEEILLLGFGSLVVCVIIAMIVLGLLFNLAVAGIVAGLVLSFFITRLLAGRMEQYKIGKPDGFFLQFIQIQADKLGLLSSRYLLRKGKWSIDRYE